MYQLISASTVKRIADGTYISLPPGESEGYKYAVWLAAGNTPAPADVPLFAPLKAAEFATFRAHRQDFLNRMTWVSAAFAGLKTPAGDAAAANALAVNNALLDMLTEPAIVGATDIIALRVALKARYRAITYAQPLGLALPVVIAAYRKVDL